MGNMLWRLIQAQEAWAKPLGTAAQRVTRAIFGPLRPLRDFLNGTWLGHPVHPALTDVPIGAFVVLLILDLLNERPAADAALVVGLLGMVAAAVTGFADLNDTDTRPRTVAAVHATLMVLGLVVYLVSLALRLGQPADRTVPVVVAVIGLAIVLAGAYVGGDVVFALGNMVNRHAWLGRKQAWVPLDLGTATDIPESTPTKGRAGSEPLLVVRIGDTVRALHDVCAHAGGPLNEGQLVGDCIQCPWNGSRFRLADGSVCGGPAVYDQPAYEVRAAETGSGYEVRRIIAR